MCIQYILFNLYTIFILVAGESQDTSYECVFKDKELWCFNNRDPYSCCSNERLSWYTCGTRCGVDGVVTYQQPNDTSTTRQPQPPYYSTTTFRWTRRTRRPTPYVRKTTPWYNKDDNSDGVESTAL